MRRIASAVVVSWGLLFAAACGPEPGGTSDLGSLSQAICCGANCCCIDGSNYADGTPNPDNPCQVCDSSSTHLDWTSAGEGAACDLENGGDCIAGTCNASDECVEGPAEVGTPCDPDDDLACTAGACDDEGACVAEVAEGCLIDEACWVDGEANPENPCEVCDSSEDTADWSPAAAGVVCSDQSCTDGNVTAPGTCDGAGSCTPGETTDCGAYRHCDGDGCATSCTNNGQCFGNCVENECVAERADGETCTADNQCASGFCVNGRCCAEACDDPCMGCSQTVTGEDHGACAPVLDGLDPRGDCDDEGAASCGSTGVCDGEGACRLYDDETVCAATACDTDGFVGEALCDGAGTCVAPDALDCGAYACEDDGCRTGCSDDAHCAEDHVCEAGACVEDEEEENGNGENGNGENGNGENGNGEQPRPGDEDEDEEGGCGGCSAASGTAAGALGLLLAGLLLRRRPGRVPAR